jgi:hypothetical protein
MREKHRIFGRGLFKRKFLRSRCRDCFFAGALNLAIFKRQGKSSCGLVLKLNHGADGQVVSVHPCLV